MSRIVENFPVVVTIDGHESTADVRSFLESAMMPLDDADMISRLAVRGVYDIDGLRVVRVTNEIDSK